LARKAQPQVTERIGVGIIAACTPINYQLPGHPIYRLTFWTHTMYFQLAVLQILFCLLLYNVDVIILLTTVFNVLNAKVK